MSDDRAIVPLIQADAPAPLAPLTHIIISPANIAAEARQQRAIRLSIFERSRMRKEIRQLQKELARAGYEALQQRRADLWAQLQRMQESFITVRERLEAAPDDSELKQQLAIIQHESRPLMKLWMALGEEYKPLKLAVNRLNQLKTALEDHRLAVRRQATEKKLMKMMVREARIYETIIIDRWTRLGYAHSYTDGKKYKTDKVRFARVGISLDAIYFEIDASYQTAFKNYKTNIPDGVKVTTQLLHDDTLQELKVACKRQVSGVHNANGAWVIVHRLESVDGLMNEVSFANVMERYPAKYHHRMPICVGVGVNRQVQWVALSEFPHWLIGGYTNSGKSNMVNVGISTLITRQTPHELRLVLIDLKGGLEFNFYDGIPHLHRGVVDSIEGVADALSELEAVMEWRFKKFKGVAKRLEDYHAKRPKEYMPRILCVFDEVASIMDHGDLTKRILASLRTLTRMGRAVGIHIWLCTQRPDVKAIEGSIKANLAVRISGRMSSTADSMTVLGNSMAKDLAAVPGRMVLQLGPDPMPIQTPKIDPEDIDEALRIAKTYQPAPMLEVPDGYRVIHQEWTVEKVIELSIKHLGGNITAQKVWQNAQADLSQAQARKLVEKVWASDCVEFEGKQYKVKLIGNSRRLIEVESN
jgi:FtsK/SpoIIIE family